MYAHDIVVAVPVVVYQDIARRRIGDAAVDAEFLLAVSTWRTHGGQPARGDETAEKPAQPPHAWRFEVGAVHVAGARTPGEWNTVILGVRYV